MPANKRDRRWSDHLRNNVVGYIALFCFAMSGTALAVAHRDSVGSPAVIDNSLRGVDIKNGQVAPADVADGALTGADLAADSVTGANINESSLDQGIVQRRVGGSCPPSQAIRDVAADGSVTCEGVGGGGSPTGPAGGDLSGSYPNPALAAGVVNSASVADNSLTGADIVDNVLTGSDVADTSSLSGPEIAESGLGVGGDLTGNVANAQLGVGSVGGAEVLSNSLTGADIADTSSVGAAEINESSLGQVPSAATAANATNADQLDGIDSTALVVGRGDPGDSGECTGTLPAVFETCADVAVTFPHAGRAFVIGSGGWEALDVNGPSALCHLQVDNVDGPEMFVGGEDAVSESYQRPVLVQMVTGVLAAGSHTFEFNCKAFLGGNGTSDIDQAYVSALEIGSG